jgi:hypothetical protein
MQPPKRRVLNKKQGGVLNKNRTMDIIQKHNICTNVPSSQTFKSYSHLPVHVMWMSEGCIHLDSCGLS